MNRRANVYLNIIGTITFIITIVLFILTMNVEGMINTNYLLRNILFLLTILSGTIFVSSELFLFVLLQNNFKALYIIYLILDIMMAILINNIIPFTYILVFIIFKLIKDTYRIINVRKIYINRRFTTYCKRYGIKFNDWKKTYKKKKVSTKRKGEITIPVPKSTATSSALSTN